MPENKIILRLNTFGPLLQKEDIEKLKNTKRSKIVHNFLISHLESFFEKPINKISSQVLDRYCEITNQETHLSITPAYDEFILRIINPLIYGKKYYCLGEYISCISMSGLVGEMLAILLWKISEFTIKGVKVSTAQEKRLFGNHFERLGQERRLEILLTMQVIDTEDKVKFHEIKDIRNKYMHLWDLTSRQQEIDAKKCITNAMLLFKKISSIGLNVDDEGKQTININPLLLKFLNSTKEGNI